MTQELPDNTNVQLSKESLKLQRDQKFVGGFYLTSKALDSVQNFHPLRLSSSWTFWHDARGNIVSKKSTKANQVVVFGSFFHLEENDLDLVVERLLQRYETSEEKFEDELDLLVGRYVVVVSDQDNNFVYHDALGTRSVYYSTASNDVSSHFNLLLEMLQIEKETDWDEARMAMDLTMSSQIRQLLPNFRLNCSSRVSNRYFPKKENEFSDWSHEEKQEEISRLWKRSIDALLSGNKSVVFSITGGLDSRLSVAMASERWNELNLYTYGTKKPKDTHYSKVMNRDYLIAQSLVSIIQPKTYKFLHLAENKRLSPELSELINTNSITRHGPGLVQRYRSEFPGDNWIHVRSTGIEVMRNYFGSDESLQSIIKMCEIDGATNFKDRISDLGYDVPQFGYNRKDLLYWELRMGKWHSEVLNENDAAFETVLPHNSRRIIKLFLAYSKKQRRDAFAIKELINSNAAMLNFFGVNDTRNLYEIIRDGYSEDIKTPGAPKAPPTGELLTQTVKIVASRGTLSAKRRLRSLHSTLTKRFK